MTKLAPSKSKVEAYITRRITEFYINEYITSRLKAMLDLIQSGTFTDSSCQPGELSTTLLKERLERELLEANLEREKSSNVYSNEENWYTIIEVFIQILGAGWLTQYVETEGAYNKELVEEWIQTKQLCWSSYYFHSGTEHLQDHMTFLKKFKEFVTPLEVVDPDEVGSWLQSYKSNTTDLYDGIIRYLLIDEFRCDAEEGSFDGE